MFSRRFIKGICLLAALTWLLLLSAQAMGKTVVTVWRREVPAHAPWYDYVKENFEKTYPDITLEWVTSGGNDNDFLTVRAIAGQLPMITDSNHVAAATLISEGVAIPLNRFSDFNTVAARYTPFGKAFIKAKGPNDVINDYLLPYGGATNCSALNVRLAQELGQDPTNYPKYWDDWLQWSRKLTRDTDGNGQADIFGTELPVAGAAWQMNSVLWQLHAVQNNWTFQDNGKNVFRTQYEAAARWFQFMQDLVPYAPPATYSANAWTQGKQGMMILANSPTVASWKSLEIFPDVKYIPYLQVSATHKQWLNGGFAGFILWNQTARTAEQQQAAWTVMKYLTGPESLVKRLEVIGEIPSYMMPLPNYLKDYQPFLEAASRTNTTAMRGEDPLYQNLDYANIREKVFARYLTVIKGQAGPRQALDALVLDVDPFFAK